MTRNQPVIHGIRAIKKDTLKNKVGAQIKELILTNKLKPGRPIVIDQLAAMFGVSHTPVREALAMLELDGLVELNSFQNPIVAPITARDVREIYEMRIMVECWAIERAATLLSDADIDPIDELLEVARREAKSGNYEPHLKADLLLHKTILKAPDNSLYWHLAQKVYDKNIRVHSLVEADGATQDVLPIIDEHCRITQALRAHDPAQAKDAMLAHLEAGLKRTLAVLDR